MERPLALVTGASSGIGREFAHLLAAAGYDIVIVARRFSRLQALAEDVRRGHGATAWPVVADLLDPSSPERIKAEVDRLGHPLDVLVNDAGVGTFGVLQDVGWNELAAMVSVNVLALTHLTRLFLPAMVARRQGKILNVGSIAGYLPGPKNAVYHATKAYVLSFSEALWQETHGTGVTVTCLCPGPTRTEFHERAGQRLRRANWMDAPTVARIGYQAMVAGKHVANAGAQNNLIAMLIRFLPRRLLLWGVQLTNRQ